jgi:hypothetical protein
MITLENRLNELYKATSNDEYKECLPYLKENHPNFIKFFEHNMFKYYETKADCFLFRNIFELQDYKLPEKYETCLKVILLYEYNLKDNGKPKQN